MANVASRGYTFGTTELVTNAKLHALVDNATLTVDTLEAGVVPVKATGAELNTGTDDAKFATAKALVDSDYAKTSDMPVKATGAEIDTGTDDAKFATAKAIADSALVSETDWTDYSATSTIVGWASFVVKKIYVKKIGKTVFVQYIITGTSDSATTTFTVPYTAAAHTFEWSGFAVDAGGAMVNNYLYLGAGEAKVTSYKNSAGDYHTNAGAKEIRGQFVYEAA